MIILYINHKSNILFYKYFLNSITMIVKIQDEEKVLQRHLLMKFRTLF